MKIKFYYRKEAVAMSRQGEGRVWFVMVDGTKYRSATNRYTGIHTPNTFAQHVCTVDGSYHWARGLETGSLFIDTSRFIHDSIHSKALCKIIVNT